MASDPSGAASSVAIIGANLAGGRAAEALRAEGFDGRITLVGSEPHPPYERPPLSKSLLTGVVDIPSTFLRTEEAWAADDVELALGSTVVSVDAPTRRLLFADGREMGADRILLCTGGRPRRLQVAGGDLDGVLYLRTIEDSQELASRLREQVQLVVIGAGFIGAEVASSARELGCAVTLVEAGVSPMERAVGRVIGERCAEVIGEHGVDLKTRVGVDRFEGDSRVRSVVLTSGEVLPADVVVVGVGLEPADELAVDLGLLTNNGVVVDERCRTSMPGVYAAGDVTRHPNSLFGVHMRLESWKNAQDQAVAAARSIAGSGADYVPVPWAWSDQFGHNLQVAGHPQPGDEVVMRGDLATTSFVAFHLRDGVLVGAVGIDRRKEIRAAMQLIARRQLVDREALTDSGTDVRKCVA